MLLLQVRKALYPITPDIVRAALKSIGELERCDVKPPEKREGHEDQHVNCVISFADSALVQEAMDKLQGRAIYPDCCYLHFSRPRELSGGMMGMGGRGGFLGGRGGGAGRGGMGMGMSMMGMGMGMGMGGGGGFVGGHGGMMMMPGGGGGIGGRGIGFGGPSVVVGGGGAESMMMMAPHYPQHQHLHHHQHQNYYQPHQHHHHHQQHQYPYGASAAPGMMGGGYPLPPGVPDTRFYLVNGASDDRLPLLRLFHLLEHYAVVLGIRRQIRPPNMCVIRFENPLEAFNCAKLVSGVVVEGLKLELRPFPQFVDRRGFAPSPGTCTDPSDVACSSFDFTPFRHRRQPKPDARGSRTNNLFPPSRNLFVANLLPEITDDEVRAFFREQDPSADKKKFEILDYERHSPLNVVITLPSIEAAVDFMASFAGAALKERFLRIQFSGFAPREGPPSTFTGTAPLRAHNPVLFQRHLLQQYQHHNLYQQPLQQQQQQQQNQGFQQQYPQQNQEQQNQEQQNPEQQNQEQQHQEHQNEEQGNDNQQQSE